MQIVEGSFVGAGLCIAVAVSRWNEFITKPLLEGALDGLRRHGVADSDIIVAWAPGSFELPIICKALAARGDVDAVIALGAIIRGATSHYDHVASATTAGIHEVGMTTGVPCIFGVVTTDTIEQAIERAGTKAGNKGFDAARTAIEMATFLRALAALGRA